MTNDTTLVSLLKSRTMPPGPKKETKGTLLGAHSGTT